MRVILPESSPARKRGLGGASASVVLHALLIGGAVATTGLRAEAPPKRTPPPPLVYVKPPADIVPRITPPAARPAERRAVTPPTPAPVDVPVVPTTSVDLTIVPTTIPAVGVPLTPIGDRVVARVAGADVGDSVGGAGGDDVAWTAMTVEREVQPLGRTTLRYPSMLRQAGVEGVVVLQYVVDTLGRAERASVRAMNEAQAQFVEAAREAILAQRFTPAEAGGRRVRQLVEQRFSFELRR